MTPKSKKSLVPRKSSQFPKNQAGNKSSSHKKSRWTLKNRATPRMPDSSLLKSHTIKAFLCGATILFLENLYCFTLALGHLLNKITSPVCNVYVNI